jgi:hypothetical protein
MFSVQRDEEEQGEQGREHDDPGPVVHAVLAVIAKLAAAPWDAAMRPVSLGELPADNARSHGRDYR